MPQPKIALALLAFIGLVPRALAAPAEVPPAARAIIDHYLQATGGRAAFEAESTLHLKGRLVAEGMKGTYEAWVRQPGCLATRLTLGSLARRTGACGGTAWETDLASRRGHVLDGKDLESSLEEAWFETEQWARADGGGGTIALGSMSFAGRVQRQALEVTPPVGRPRTLWFDLRTGFLDRVRSSRDHYDGEEWRVDYRPMGGRKRPTGARPVGFSFDGDEDGLTIDSVWANVPVPAALFEPPNAGSDAVAWLKGGGMARLPFRYESRAVWVRASINGAPPADFILDTGCSITALDRDYAMSVGLTPEGSSTVEGVGAVAEASFSTVRRLRITAPDGDGVEVRGLKVGLVDLSEEMEPILWRKTAGLIGYDFISHFALEIDYDCGTLTFHDPARFAYAGKGQAIPMGLAHGVPTIEATLDGDCSGRFLVDVGNGSCLAIHGSMVRRCGLARSSRREIESYGGGIGGGFPEWLGRLDSLRIGPFVWREPLVGLTLSNQGGVGSQDYSGNIGNSVLEKFTCTFDYARGRLYLEPGRRFDERDVYSRLGAYFARVRDRVYAVGIVRDSPADSAGLRRMDDVRAIDGRSILELTPADLDRLFTQGPDGTVHTITVVRDLKKVELEVTLHDVI
jgi:hypothetical protein